MHKWKEIAKIIRINENETYLQLNEYHPKMHFKTAENNADFAVQVHSIDFILLCAACAWVNCTYTFIHFISSWIEVNRIINFFTQLFREWRIVERKCDDTVFLWNWSPKWRTGFPAANAPSWTPFRRSSIRSPTSGPSHCVKRFELNIGKYVKVLPASLYLRISGNTTN